MTIADTARGVPRAVPHKKTMKFKDNPGGVIQTYQKYDPVQFPSPTAPPPDIASAAMEHMLAYGDLREFTEEELANAIEIDPSQIQGFMGSIDNIRQRLLERRRKILETYETDHVQKLAARQFRDAAKEIDPPAKLAKEYHRAIKDEQLYELEQIYFPASRMDKLFARDLVKLASWLGQKYQIDELASKWEFIGQERLTIDKALEVKAELEEIEQLLKELEEARKNAKLAYINMEALERYAEMEDLEQLRNLTRAVNEYLKDIAEKEGLERTDKGYRLTPKAVKLFQSRVLTTIFSQLQAGRSGRHEGPIIGEGAVELQATKPYEFGDSVAQMDIPQTLLNSMLRQGNERPLRLHTDDIVVHRTKNNPKAATCVLLDMSGSMRYGGLYINVKRMALALDGLIRKEFPGDYLQFIEMYSVAKPRHVSEIAGLLPKPVTIYNSIVRLKADLSNPNISELDLPPHFTNIQHALQQGRMFLSGRDTPNRQIVLITDGLPTAHFEQKHIYFLYPPDSRTEEATLREAKLCQREGITINIFLLSSWNQSEEDVRFAYKLAESTKGRVFFVAGRELDRFVVWDYLLRRRSIVA
jgi:uncharacterized protein with von Willebrand factor type A (vWA) domain